MIVRIKEPEFTIIDSIVSIDSVGTVTEIVRLGTDDQVFKQPNGDLVVLRADAEGFVKTVSPSLVLGTDVNQRHFRIKADHPRSLDTTPAPPGWELLTHPTSGHRELRRAYADGRVGRRVRIAPHLARLQDEP